jgi:hypothetical protein
MRMHSFFGSEPNGHLRRVYIVLIVLAALLLLLLLLALPRPASGDQPDAALFNSALDAYERQDWFNAAINFALYLQANPLMVGNPNDPAAVHFRLRKAIDLLNSRCTGATSRYSQGNDPPMSRLAPSSAPSYPMVCRGGGPMTLTFMQRSSDFAGPQLVIDFTRAGQGVGREREWIDVLPPGECAWLDRAIAPDEPSRLIVHDPALGSQDFFITWNNDQVRYVSGGGSARLRNANGYVQYMATNDFRGHFIATAFQSCTPGPNEAAFFVDYAYQGSCVVKGIGEYSNPDQMGLPNDSISSIQTGKNVQVRVCSNSGMTGYCATVVGNDANLYNKLFDGSDWRVNDNITSFRVELR